MSILKRKKPEAVELKPTPRERPEPVAHAESPAVIVPPVVADYQPCPVCGTNRSHLQPDAPCAVDGYVPRSP